MKKYLCSSPSVKERDFRSTTLYYILWTNFSDATKKMFVSYSHRDRCGVCGALERERARSRSESEDEWRCLQPYT